MREKQVSKIVFFNYAINPFLLFALGYIFFEAITMQLGLITQEADRNIRGHRCHRVNNLWKCIQYDNMRRC